MKMGIERVLKSAFGEQLIEVIQVDVQDTSANADVINEHLNILRPAIEGYSTPCFALPCSHCPDHLSVMLQIRWSC